MQTIASLLPKGYCISPNNICGCPGVMIYPAGGGVPEPRWPLDVNLRPDGEIVIGQVQARPGSLTFEPEHYCKDAEAFLEHCRRFGKISEPGIAAHPQNWD